MITYRATNTKNGRYYIGSAKTYCHYMNRMGGHHMTKQEDPFHMDLQTDPRSFTWEILREDYLTTRDYEKELLRESSKDPLMYNLYRNEWKEEKPVEDGPRWSKETREKMRESAKKESAQPAHKREAQSRAVSATNAKKSPCPHCGMLMNIGNLTKHLKGTRCKGKTTLTDSMR